ncbi:MAG: tRNA glutamyl-Q(34) synthetase GluQRS [Gammaproteobacteria bacterium]|nr:tRNA glutamyl-Q(34) synthetase GluQRS [Gammaproteobacteria bacterium]
MSQPLAYRGRFAPSPTGPLHFGSLIAAVGSYLQARSQNGEWWLRIENIDPPREVEGAIDAILYSLEAHGLSWDSKAQYQQARQRRYAEALDEIQQSGRLYACSCSRQQIAKAIGHTTGPLIYPGTCRGKSKPQYGPHALRIDTRDSVIQFEDMIQGNQQIDLAKESGDFVLRRADGLFSYQLAVALDDVEQGITEVVRGCDLLDSTPRQIFVQQLLGFTPPRYAHLPVAIDPITGHKLSKQTMAPALNDKQAVQNLWQVLEFLGQQPPLTLRDSNVEEFWSWAIPQWQFNMVPRLAAISVAPHARIES